MFEHFNFIASSKPIFSNYNPKVAKCLHFINFQDSHEPYFKRPLTLDECDLFKIFMSKFIWDWKEISKHHFVPTPKHLFEKQHSTYFLRKNRLWKPPTSLTILAEDYPRYGRYCTQYTEHDARFLYFLETKVDVFHTPFFQHRNLHISTRFSINSIDNHLIIENEKIIEENQAAEERVSAIKPQTYLSN